MPLKILFILTMWALYFGEILEKKENMTPLATWRQTCMETTFIDKSLWLYYLVLNFEAPEPRSEPSWRKKRGSAVGKMVEHSAHCQLSPSHDSHFLPSLSKSFPSQMTWSKEGKVWVLGLTEEGRIKAANGLYAGCCRNPGEAFGFSQSSGQG